MKAFPSADPQSPSDCSIRCSASGRLSTGEHPVLPRGDAGDLLITSSAHAILDERSAHAILDESSVVAIFVV
jgi:hypothetical protein